MGGLFFHVLRLAVVLAAWSSVSARGQAPANDVFEERLPLGALVESITATNTLATSEVSEPAHRSAPAAKSLWWRWVAPLDGYVVVDSTNGPVRGRVAVYDGVKQLPLLRPEPVRSESGLPVAPDHYEFSAFNGLHYNLAVDDLNGVTGVFQLDLKVYTTPQIVTQPVGATVTAGQRASIAVRALGKLALTNQWQFSTRSPNTGFTNLPGGANPQFDIGPFGVVRKGDEGWYRVIVRNEYGGVTSSVVRINVNECAIPLAPQPAAVATNVGKTVSFTASALGTQPFFFQWQFKVPGQFVYADLPGATSSNLVLNNLSTDQAGDYRFLVSNISCTNQASTSVALTVSTNNALVLDPNFPTDLTLVTNQNATFDVRVSEGYQPLGYQWWYQPDSGPARIVNGETAPSLFLPGVQLGQAGRYWATVSNRYRLVASRQARLNVETRPPNDNFQNRIPIFPDWLSLSTTNVSRTNVSGWNKNATAEAGEPNHQGRTPAFSVWWSFTPPVDGRVLLTLAASGPAPVLAAYTGDAVNRLVPVANRTNRLDFYDFVATNNIEYFFAVESQAGSYQQNSIDLELIFNPVIDGPTVVGQPGDLDGPDGDGDFSMLGDGVGGCRTFDQFRVLATSLDGVVFYQWQFGPTTNGPFADLIGMTNATLVLTNVTTANQGWYRARVSNRSPSVAYTISVHLMVGIGPSITGQPTNVVTNACGSASFVVKTESCTPMAYQWRHNGLPVTAPNAFGVNSTNLVLTSLTPANAGNYDVVIRNANLAITSQVATLTVNSNPSITGQPQSITRHACEPAAFTVAAVATCPLTYQWFFRRASVNGGTNATLDLPSVLPADDGDYIAVIRTPFASVTSQVARLTVQTSPVILAHPAAQNARACDIVNLAVQAQAEPPCSWLAYQWQLAGTNIAGATNRIYSFEAQAETAGDYRVVVSNHWTGLTSSVARVTVDASPFITVQPTVYQRVREGDSFTNRIELSTCGALSYTWQFKPFGAADFSPMTLNVRHRETNGWLIVDNVQTNESGFYRTIITNIHGSVTSSVAQIRIVRPPANDHFANAFSLGQTNQVTATGHNEFATPQPSEPAHGLQPASHSVWWRWTSPSPSLVTVDLAGSDIDTTLGIYAGSVISNLTMLAQDDDGGANGRSRVSFIAGGGRVIYIAIDGKREAEGTNLVLSLTATPINSPPIITQQPQSLAAAAGETVSFTNISYGSPDITVQWFGKGSPRQSVTQIVGLTNYLSVLTLNNVTTNDDGVYYAIVSNSFGAVTSRLATLTLGSLVRGLVTDATRTTPSGAAIGIPGVRISIGNVSTVTDQDGNYELSGVQPGELRADFMADKTRVRLNENIQFWNRSTLTAAVLIATKEGYYDYVDTEFEVGPGRTVAKRFSMSPIFQGLRLVLNWTNKPNDLDLLLHFPPSVPVSYPWIDYLQRNRGSTSAPPFSIRDVDTTQGWGPETISIHRFYPGTYSLYARKYPGEAGFTLTQSDAEVVAYLGGGIAAGAQIRSVGSVHVPTSGTNEWWHVCDIDGQTTNIIWINRLLASAPGGLEDDSGGGFIAAGGIPVGLDQAAQAPVPAQSPPTAGLNYEWNFGDGSPVSTQPEPIHVYAEPGWKSVSLTITERIGSPPKSHTATKTNYIYVENLPPSVAIKSPLTGTIFRASDTITLQSVADGIDDAILRVEYYLMRGQQPVFLGAAVTPPYIWAFANTNFADATNYFLARAVDAHGAATWSSPVVTRTLDLRGDILILRNFPSSEIDAMAAYLDEPMIRGRSPVVKVLDQEGLTFELVQGFKLIIWNDQGQTDGGLTDNDVGVLRQAYDAGIPLFLIGAKLGESRDFLRDERRFDQWTKLVGVEKSGDIPGPLIIEGHKAVYEDGLFFGWYWEADTILPYTGSLERLSLTTDSMEIVADISMPGVVTNSPIMLRYPPFTQPDFGETRRLVQNFRVTSDQGAESAFDRQVLFINSVAWLLQVFECQEINVALNCLAPPPLPGAVPDGQGRIPSGRVGQLMTNVTLVTQNGECTAGGVLITNALSPGLELISAEVMPTASWVPTNNYIVTLDGNSAIARFSEMPFSSYHFRTVVVPTRGGWVTNVSTVRRGLATGASCSQQAFIAEPFQLTARLAANGFLLLNVTGGAGHAFQIQSSTDLVDWQDVLQILPDRDPYAMPVAPPAGPMRFFRLRQVD